MYSYFLNVCFPLDDFCSEIYEIEKFLITIYVEEYFYLVFHRFIKYAYGINSIFSFFINFYEFYPLKMNDQLFYELRVLNIFDNLYSESDAKILNQKWMLV